jgi:hypothetical protein
MKSTSILFMLITAICHAQTASPCYMESALAYDHHIVIKHINADSLPCGADGSYRLKKQKGLTYFKYHDQRVYLDMKMADDSVLKVLMKNYEPPEFPGYMPGIRMAFLIDTTGLIIERGLAWGTDYEEWENEMRTKARSDDFHFTPYLVDGKPVVSLAIILVRLDILRDYKALHR